MLSLSRTPRLKSLRSSIAVACLLALGMLLVPATPAQAASLNVDVDIIWPSILILYCYSDVDITVTSAVLAELVTGTANGDQGIAVAGPGTANATVSGTGLTADVNLGSPDTDLAPGVDLSNLALTIQDVCAIRAIQTNGGSGVQVSIAYTANTTLTNGGTGTITLTGTPQVQINGGGFGSPATFTPSGLGTTDAVDVQLILDASSADEAGTYSSAVDDNITVTATLI